MGGVLEIIFKKLPVSDVEFIYFSQSFKNVNCHCVLQAGVLFVSHVHASQ